MKHVDDDFDERRRPEELDDEARADVLERVESSAQRRHVTERERLTAAGIVDAQGRLLKEPAKAVHSDGLTWMLLTWTFIPHAADVEGLAVPIVVGIVAGAAAARALGRLLEGLLFGVKPSDPGAFALAAAALGVVALLAGYFPARRSSLLDPMTVLRES
jgi:hypothetical protein